MRVIVLALLLAYPAAGAAEIEDGQRLLAQARTVCGGAAWDSLAGWHERGRLTTAGRAGGAYEAWNAITRPATAVRGDAAIGFAGFDGTTYWRVLPSGTVDVGSEPAIVRKRARDAYLSNFGYFLPARFPATVAEVGSRTLKGVAFDVVAVTPRGAEGFELWLDHATHHVASIVIVGQVAELSGYRDFGGVCAPTTLVQSDGNPAHTTTFHVDSVETAALPSTVFEAPR